MTVDLAADAVKDVPGNGIAEVLGTSVSVEDNTAPTFVSAGTNGTDEVVLTYDEALNTTQPATSAFTVKVGGTGRGVDTVAISGSAVTLTLASAFRPGDTLTVSLHEADGHGREPDQGRELQRQRGGFARRNDGHQQPRRHRPGRAVNPCSWPMSLSRASQRMNTRTGSGCSGTRRGTTAATSRSISTATLRAPRSPQRPRGTDIPNSAPGEQNSN